jgi:TPR repeat protein
MKKIFKALFFFIALLTAVPVIAQSDFEVTKARAEAGDAQSQYDLGEMYASGDGVIQNYQEAASWFTLASEQGLANAQYNLGFVYASGRGVAKNDQEAASWYRLAAEQGLANAQYNLGVMYGSGEGVAKNDQEAVRWYRLAAEQGLALAQYNLGVMHGSGEGVAKNDQEAVRWYRLAADQGNAFAQHNLGFMYEYGTGVAQSNQEAVRWYRLAAEQGLANAQYNLGVMYANGDGVAGNDQEAVRWLRLAADQGLADAQTNLGVMYANGLGVAENDQEAVRWYRLAAEQEFALAQYNLGVMYANGEGVTVNDQEALRWLRLAADQGLADAQNNLGYMYDNGEGVAENDQEAIKWYRLAAEQGWATAQFNLGIMYEIGEGVVENDQEAVKWFRFAAEQGNSKAQERLQALNAEEGSNNGSERTGSKSEEFSLIQTIMSLSIWQIIIFVIFALAALGHALNYWDKKAVDKKNEERFLLEKRISKAKKELSMSQKAEIAVSALTRYEYATVSKIIPVLEKEEEIQNLLREFNNKLIPVYESLMEENGLERELIGEDIWNEILNECLEFGNRLIKKHDFNGTTTFDRTSENPDHLSKISSINESEIRSPQIVHKSEAAMVFGEKKEKISKSAKKTRRWGIFTVSLMMVINHFADMMIAESSIVSPYAAFWIYASYLALKDDMKTLSDWLKFLIAINAIALAAILLFNFDTTYLGMSKEEMLWGIGLALIIQTLVYMRAKHLLGRSLV